MQRRGFVRLVAGLAACRPMAAFAQSAERQRRVGVLMNLAADDPEGQTRLKALLDGLQQQGWSDGRNLQVQTCWGAGKAERYRSCAVELVGATPDVILAGSGSTMPALTEATRTLPIVFVQAVDPVGSGWVASLAEPGGNITGFTQFDFSMGGKWLELLKQLAPAVGRAVVLRDPGIGEGTAQFAAIQSAASALRLELTPVGVREPDEIERGVAAFASRPDGGMIVTASAYTAVHRKLITALAAHHRLPAVYPYRYFITSGGLVSYGPDPVDPYRRAAEYVRRILNGEKPAQLPVQAATKVQLIVNLKAARELGLAIAPSLVARADEVIE
jgi:putative tryptophan/tyrosine transport system substrate-binding protein